MSAARGEEEELWAAVGEPSRRRLLEALLARGEATASVLAQELPFTRQAVTKHLAVLDRSGLVPGRRQGREVRYVNVGYQLLDRAPRGRDENGPSVPHEWLRRRDAYAVNR